LNPQGLNVVKKKSGNFILWGDRTISVEPEWRFAHQRELMSYYELVFLEAFDFIIFGLNNSDERATVNTSFQTFFLTEYGKGALDTDVPFPSAAVIKIDTENNPDIVKQAGDMVAELSLKLVGVVERLRIFVSKQGVFEGV
jgi:phage tail sheath protein FI